MKKRGFQVEEDGTISVRYGTQTNCAGIAQIQVRIAPIPNSGIQLLLDSEFYHTNSLTEEDICTFLISAVFKGAEEAYKKFVLPEGIEFTLLNALVHPIDSNKMVFKMAGEMAVIGWHQLRSETGDVCYENICDLMRQLHQES